MERRGRGDEGKCLVQEGRERAWMSINQGKGRGGGLRWREGEGRGEEKQALSCSFFFGKVIITIIICTYERYISPLIHSPAEVWKGTGGAGEAKTRKITKRNRKSRILQMPTFFYLVCFSWRFDLREEPCAQEGDCPNRLRSAQRAASQLTF